MPILRALDSVKFLLVLFCVPVIETSVSGSTEDPELPDVPKNVPSAPFDPDDPLDPAIITVPTLPNNLKTSRVSGAGLSG